MHPESAQGIVGFVGGAPICWESVRQPFVAQSTAAGELIGYCEGLTVGRALGEKVRQKRTCPQRGGGQPTPVKGRRMGSGAHAGAQLVADGLTKMLLGQAFGNLVG